MLPSMFFPSPWALLWNNCISIRTLQLAIYFVFIFLLWILEESVDESIFHFQLNLKLSSILEFLLDRFFCFYTTFFFHSFLHVAWKQLHLFQRIWTCRFLYLSSLLNFGKKCGREQGGSVLHLELNWNFFQFFSVCLTSLFAFALLIFLLFVSWKFSRFFFF
jgi:hypothetical protein